MSYKNAKPPVGEVIRDVPTLVRATRQTHGLTLAQMGELLGVTFEAVRQWEAGMNEPRKVPEIQRIVEMEPGIARDFWLDLFMIRQRRAHLKAIETFREAAQVEAA